MYKALTNLSELEMRKIHRVVVIDIDPVARIGLVSMLDSYGFDVGPISQTREIDSVMTSADYDIIVVSWSHKVDMVSLLLRFGALPNQPGVIILAADSCEADRIIGLELGADDFVNGPCSNREVVARIRAVLRRRLSDRRLACNSIDRPRSINNDSSKGYYRFSGWTLHCEHWLLYAPGGDQVTLTAAECWMLSLLLKNPGVPHSREDLRENKGHISSASSRTVDTNIARLRRKLESFDAEPIIRTVRGKGYAIAPDVSFHS